ncbi:endonuclease [Rhizobium sp. 768_B6_N1_8]|uniref:endonuclease n=1 Tax=Rhizobium sp. 768_B6_N1_8 TaxID=3240773 RepID=UPI003F270ACC
MDSTQDANRSREEQMAVERLQGASAPKSEADWGIDNLAIVPGDVQKTRSLRDPRFEGLPTGASTMFEELSVTLEQVVDSNDLRPAWWLEEGAARSRAVCKIDASGVDYKGRSGSWSGSGFLVAPGILCTNHHVLNSKEVADRSRALFDFAALADGSVRQVSTFRLRPDLLFWTSPVVASGGQGGLDVTFVGVDGEPGATFGSVPLLRQAFVVAEDDKLNIIQHPDGKLKEVAIRNNKVVFQNTQVIHYESDTQAGSSGAPVMNDGWELIALHHAAKDTANEGIKFSAIAAALELEAQTGNADAARIFRIFGGTDELVGFFGTLGRTVSQNDSGMERVVDAYKGEDQDLDIGFWNIEWFNKRWQDKLDSVARVIVEMNLDVWVFVESSLEATEALARHLETNYRTKRWGVLASQDATSEKQITTVMWNSGTVTVTAKDWPAKVERWLQVDSRQFDDLGLEAVHGRVFDRYPALYEVKAKIRDTDTTFNLVPIHLKAMGEGSLRRQMAARLLAEAVAELAKDESFDTDWIIGGDANATLASGDLDPLTSAGLTALTAQDAAQEQITYVKAPFKSLIDHVFISPNLVPDGRDFMIVALDRNIDRFQEVSDHRPILLRLAATGTAHSEPAAGQPLSEDELRRLSQGLRRRNDPPAGTLSLEEARTRLADRGTYYDGTADAIVRGAYWNGVSAGTAGFASAVAGILKRTHAKPLSYEPSAHVYPWVDVRENGKVQSIYSGFEATSEYFIQADREVERLRTKARSALLESGVLESTDLESMLEAQFQYNCEHVVPQSWFNKNEPMRGDLHHLFSCEPRCNSFRSNHPLVQHEFERTMQDCGRVEDETFEPKGGKGAVARATLYFMLRYPGVVGRRYVGQRLKTLLAWHEQYAPDEWERHRNAAIYTLQGNRNPLIDFPEWALRLQFEG